MNNVELAELDALRPMATVEEREWAIREAAIIDPGTDSPAAKLVQRRRRERQEALKARADAGAESPLLKFERVWSGS